MRIQFWTSVDRLSVINCLLHTVSKGRYVIDMHTHTHIIY